MDIVSSHAFNLSSKLKDPESTFQMLAKVAIEADSKSFTLLQETVNFLAHKLQSGLAVTEAEKSFLQTVYSCPWWGGKEHGLNEAKRVFGSRMQGEQSPSLTPVADSVQLSLAQMAQHFVQGDGQYYPLNLTVYRNASIVKDTVCALRDYIRGLHIKGQPSTMVRTTDSGFLQSEFAHKIEEKRQKTETKGFIFSDGTLILDQKDPRLMTLGNRFSISAMTSPMNTHLLTRWRVEGTYRFENFKEGEANTGLPLSDEHVLVLPSCLGVGMAEKGFAKVFSYFTDWAERYSLIKM